MYASPLRDGGYDIADFYAIHPDYGTIEDFARFIDGGPPARHPRDRRPRDEPHVVGPPVVPGVAPRRRTSPSATGTCGRTPTSATRTRGSSSSTPSRRTGRGTSRPAQYYWHRFFSHQPDLNFDNPEVQRGDARGAALLAGPRARRLPPRRRALPLRARRAPTARTSPRRTSSSSSVRARSTRSTPTASCSPRPTSGPRTSSSTSARATSATWPSTSRSCRACSWRCAARTRRRSSRSSTARRRSPTTASGACSCATTTS